MAGDIKAPGLKWRTRADGRRVPLWIAADDAIAAGYPCKSMNLTGLSDDEIVARCNALWADMRAWLTQRRADLFDGTLGALIGLYQTHESSHYHRLKPSSRHPYDVYLRRLRDAYGDRRLDRLTGLDIMAWHRDWRAPDAAGGREKLGAAAMALGVLKSALSFGVVAGITDCVRLVTVARELKLPQPAPREFAPTAADVVLVRAAAHRLGHPRAALAYALQFETMARQWDIAGQWVPIGDERPSAILNADGRRKWLGPTWAAIGADNVLTIKPTKTERSTGAKVHISLSACQMVMDELALIPAEERTGPLISFRGAPYSEDTFQWVWREARAAAELPAGMWNRDLRAGGVTEAQIAGATSEDRAKLAGHSQKMNEKVYARDRLAASGRVVELRAKLRGAK